MEGIERLKKMLLEEDKMIQAPLLKIIMYLKTREDMDEKYLNSEKCLHEMYEYICGKVQKHMVNQVAFLDDSVVYGLAIHYFDETNEALGLNKKEEKTKVIAIDNYKPKIEVSNTKEREQISLFEGDF